MADVAAERKIGSCYTVGKDLADLTKSGCRGEDRLLVGGELYDGEKEKGEQGGAATRCALGSMCGPAMPRFAGAPL